MLPPVNYDNLLNIGVDEISFKKGYKYITIIYDLTSSKAKPMDYQEGNTKESLNNFFNKLTQQQKASIKTVNTDMSKAFISSIRKELPEADIIVDKFHLERELNYQIDLIRKNIIGEMSIKSNKIIIKSLSNDSCISKEKLDRQEKRIGILNQTERKNTRWVILKHSTNHTERQSALLSKLEQLNSPLYKAYLLKEQFYELLKPKAIKTAREELLNWMKEAKATELKPLIHFCKTIENHFDFVINYFVYGRTSGAIEGINNKIKVMKRMAYGYKDQQYFFRKIRSKYCALPRLHLLFASSVG
jgi:transposase